MLEFKIGENVKLIAKYFKELTITELYEILKARAKIFIVEQNINFQDLDDIDYNSLHCFFIENNKVIAYIRAFYEDENAQVVRLGRALTIEHQKGYGKSLMEQSLKAVKEKMKCKKLWVILKLMPYLFMNNLALKRYQSPLSKKV